jgi:hypothetical protein
MKDLRGLPGTSEHGVVQGGHPLDVRDRARETWAINIGERQPASLVIRAAFGLQLVVAILDVLRDLVDDFDAAEGRYAEGGESPIDGLLPPERWRRWLLRHVRGS